MPKSIWDKSAQVVAETLPKGWHVTQFSFKGGITEIYFIAPNLGDDERIIVTFPKELCSSTDQEAVRFACAQITAAAKKEVLPEGVSVAGEKVLLPFKNLPSELFS